jgi:hypothetical protein
MNKRGNDVPVNSFNDNSYHTTEGCTDGHGRYENACGNFTTIGNDDESRSDDSGEEERVGHGPLHRCSDL